MTIADQASADEINSEGNRVDYNFKTAEGIDEAWIVNDEQGLQIGLILTGPTSDIPLKLLGFSGSLSAHLNDESQGVAFSHPEGDSVLRMDTLRVKDANGHPLPAHIEFENVEGQQERLHIMLDESTSQYPLTVTTQVTGLSSSADWTAESDQADARFGVSVGTAGDVNGDGYSDVIVGAHKYDNGQSQEGRAFVYYGSASGLSSTADWTAESPSVTIMIGQLLSII